MEINPLATTLAVLLVVSAGTSLYLNSSDGSLTYEFNTAGLNEQEHFVVKLTPIDNQTALMETWRYHEDGTLIGYTDQAISRAIYDDALNESLNRTGETDVRD